MCTAGPEATPRLAAADAAAADAAADDAATEAVAAIAEVALPTIAVCAFRVAATVACDPCIESIMSLSARSALHGVGTGKGCCVPSGSVFKHAYLSARSARSARSKRSILQGEVDFFSSVDGDCRATSRQHGSQTNTPFRTFRLWSP